VRLVLHTDGASRGNPGPAGVGVVLSDADGRVLAEVARFLGETTNNQAEYAALLEGLRQALELGAEEVLVRSDSELLVRQILGEYHVRNPKLRPLFETAKELLRRFRSWRIEHVPREANARADELANLAIDRAAAPLPAPRGDGV